MSAAATNTAWRKELAAAAEVAASSRRPSERQSSARRAGGERVGLVELPRTVLVAVRQRVTETVANLGGRPERPSVVAVGIHVARMLQAHLEPVHETPPEAVHRPRERHPSLRLDDQVRMVRLQAELDDPEVLTPVHAPHDLREHLERREVPEARQPLDEPHRHEQWMTRRELGPLRVRDPSRALGLAPRTLARAAPTELLELALRALGLHAPEVPR
jgi:hypothetical protein